MKPTPEQRKQEMYDLIARWQLSGQNQKEFCRQENVSHHTFKYYTTQRNKEIKKDHSVSKFVPVTVSTAKPSKGFKISYPNGVSIAVDETISSDLLRTLIHLY